jgi:uncharacterized protein
MDLAAKSDLLSAALKREAPLLVAYSGGVDSAFLAYEAHRVLGEKMLAVIADSPSLARAHREDAMAFAQEHSIPVEVVSTSEMENPEYVRNDGLRCFHCKDELFTVLERFRDAHRFKAIAYGVNVDDEGDFRPGQRAAQQHGVVAPLLHAQLTKADIRQLAQKAGLRVWDKPASACLSSRLEYGRPVTREALAQVEAGEEALRSLGFRQFRARHHGQIVRIEISSEELIRALTPETAAEFVRIFKQLGFQYVTLDLEGFRSGSMNAVLPLSALKGS